MNNTIYSLHIWPDLEQFYEVKKILLFALAMCLAKWFPNEGILSTISFMCF